MRNNNEKRIAAKAGIFMTAMTVMAANAFAADFKSVYEPIVNLLNDLLGPMLAIVAALGTLYCVMLGIKYAKAEEPQDREKAKAHLKNAIIGFALIFVLILALNMLLPVMKLWVNESTGKTIFTDVAKK